jgi:outer membrane protein OmpA-like peptidoglycan-associated protein
MSDPKHAILARRARFVTAALAGLGCSPAAKPVDPGTAHDIVIPPLDDAGPAPVASNEPPPATEVDHPIDAGMRIPMVCLSIIIPPKILFQPNGTTPISTALVDTVAETLKANPQVNVEIEGHTDPNENSALGQKRADEVKWELVKRGIAQTRLTTTNAGATKPITPNTTDAGRAKNRRVELIVH